MPGVCPASPVRVQPVFDAKTGGVLYLEVFSGVAHADWHARDEAVFSDLVSLTRILSDAETLKAIGFPMAFNISFLGAISCGTDFVTKLHHCFRGHATSIEVTEHGVEHMDATGIDALSAFSLRSRDCGMGVILDDVEDGHPYRDASLWARCDIQMIKCLAAGSAANTMICDAHAMNIAVALENVETPTQVAAARATGADALQGYALGRPRPLPDLRDTHIERWRQQVLAGGRSC
jgi:EAL domain-containing protein (putative c-di-GMP-specific phosphodiesterase class I)